jgi:MoaA/NifB/PqqE/SkfB family radical SAM enzyme
MSAGKLRSLNKTIWSPSKNCDQNCDFCYGYDKQNTYNYQTYSEMLVKLKALGARKFIWSGGEPLQFKPLEYLIGEARKKDIENIVVTNGRSLTTERIDGLADMVKEIRVSIHSLNPEFNARHQISKPSDVNYEKNMFKILQNASGHRFDLTTSTVYLGQSENDMIQMAEQFARLGIKEWTFQEFVGIRGTNLRKKSLWSVTHINNAIKRLTQLGYPMRISLNSANRLCNEYNIVDPIGNLTIVRGGKDILVGSVVTQSAHELQKALDAVGNEKTN